MIEWQQRQDKYSALNKRQANDKRFGRNLFSEYR